MEKVLWDSTAQPVTTTLHQLMYALRVDDKSDGLMLDAVTMDELMGHPDIDETGVLDALVVQVARMQQKMDMLKAVMTAAGDAIKPVEMTISDPVRALGVLQVMVLFLMSDGQTISLWFHNPDTTPAKLTPMDELISWKWMLNKKDVTIVVAPERGKDLNVREVARRVMRLIERNSEAFKKANAKTAERAAQTEAVKGEIVALENELASLNRKIEVAEQVKADTPVAPKVIYPEPTPKDIGDGSTDAAQSMALGTDWSAKHPIEKQSKVHQELMNLGWDVSFLSGISTKGGATCRAYLLGVKKKDEMTATDGGFTIKRGSATVSDVLLSKFTTAELVAVNIDQIVIGHTIKSSMSAPNAAMTLPREKEAGGFAPEQIKAAIQRALNDTDGQVQTGDSMVWALSRTSLNKMVASNNQDGQKPFQKERILAIQSIRAIASIATEPSIRSDDKNVPEIESIYEYFSTFETGGRTYKVRLLCKKFVPESPAVDKMHSMKLDGAPADQISPDGLLINLEIIGDVAELGNPDLSLPPSVEGAMTIPQSGEIVNTDVFSPSATVDAAYKFASAADRAYLQSLIDGTADMFAADIFEKLEPMFTKYESVADMMAVLNEAAAAYSQAAVKAAQEALAA